MPQDTPTIAVNIAIVGSTASGKTGLSYALAEHLPASYVCCDSIQLYKGFDIGSAKPTAEEMSRYPHYLFDSVPATQDYDAKAYRRDAQAAIAEIRSAGRVPVVVGGTGLYLRALMNQQWHDDLPSSPEIRAELVAEDSAVLYERLKVQDPERAAQLHSNDKLRVSRALEIIALTGKPVSELYEGRSEASSERWWIIHLDPPRELVLQQIEQRTRQLLADGLIAEVEGLLAQGLAPELKPFASIGYKQVMDYLAAGGGDQAALYERIVIATRQYAKRQRTWFRGIAGDITTRLTEPVITAEILNELSAQF